MAEYIPGKCNIGTAEVKKRQQVGIVGLTVSVLYVIVVLIIRANPIWRLLLFIPVFFATTGFLQARMHFCSGYGLRGVYNIGNTVGNTDTVEQLASRKKDKKIAIGILEKSIYLAFIIALIFYVS